MRDCNGGPCWRESIVRIDHGKCSITASDVSVNVPSSTDDRPFDEAVPSVLVTLADNVRIWITLTEPVGVTAFAV